MCDYLSEKAHIPMLMCVSEGVRVVSVSVYGCLCMCSHVYICLCVCVCPGHSPQVNGGISAFRVGWGPRERILYTATPEVPLGFHAHALATKGWPGKHTWSQLSELLLAHGA